MAGRAEHADCAHAACVVDRSDDRVRHPAGAGVPRSLARQAVRQDETGPPADLDTAHGDAGCTAARGYRGHRAGARRDARPARHLPGHRRCGSHRRPQGLHRRVHRLARVDGQERHAARRLGRNRGRQRRSGGPRNIPHFAAGDRQLGRLGPSDRAPCDLSELVRHSAALLQFLDFRPMAVGRSARVGALRARSACHRRRDSQGSPGGDA